MKLNPDAILFDMDGVLVDTLDSWLYALNNALKEFGRKELTKQEFLDVYWGHDLYDNIEKMGLENKIGDFCNTLYGNHIDLVKMFPDTKKTLKKLDSYKKGIITNTPREWAIKILEKFDIKKFFKVVMTSDDVVKAKPHPDIIFKACKNLSVKPEETVVIGDTRSDVIAARKAGCKIIGIDIDADIRVSSISDLIKVFK